MIVGIQGVQGSGKTTLCQNLSKNYEVISLDDFYFSNRYIENLYYYTKEPLWRYRGNPERMICLCYLIFFKSLKTIKNVVYQFPKNI